MCLIFISFNHHPTYKLIVAANRDEFYARRTSPAEHWPDFPNIIAGRDLEAGGTWMGITRSGRISMLTNYRDLKNLKPVAPSRGHLVSRYLETETRPEQYARDVEKRGGEYNGFNLIVGDTRELWYHSNYSTGTRQLEPGIYGLSNHRLDSPWPKVVRGKQKLTPLLARKELKPDELMEALYDDKTAPDDHLPDTGIGLERERALSSMFIKAGNYGSRCTTVVLVDRSDHVTFAERVYDTVTFNHQSREFQFQIDPSQ
jgi:uncharacterized protein with NRDE domain